MVADKLEAYRKLYFSNELPVPYMLKCGVQVEITPIKVKDWEYVESNFEVLSIDKDKIPNAEIISMNYLDFLYYLISQKADHVSNMLTTVLTYSLGEHSYSLVKQGKRNRTFLRINDLEAEISSREFDDITQIILAYNFVNYDSRKMSQDLQELISDYYEIQSKNNNYRQATLEEQKIFVMLKSGYSMQQINEMPYRTFSQLYSTSLNCDIYLANKIIQSSQKYETKEEVVHPLLEPKVDIFEKIFRDKDQYVNELKSKI